MLRDEILAALAAEGDLSGFDLFPVPEAEARHSNLSNINSPTTSILLTLSTPSSLTSPYPPTVTPSTATQSTASAPVPVVPAPAASTAMANIPMLSRGDRSAPKFDPKQPCELRRYFDDLDFAFGRAAVTTDDVKKQHACRYVDVDTSELWETLAEYTDATKTYDEFKDAVYALIYYRRDKPYNNNYNKRRGR